MDDWRKLSELDFDCQTVDSYGHRSCFRGSPKPISCCVIIPSSHFQYLVSDEVLTGTVTLDNGGHHLLGHISVVGEELLGVFGQTVAAVAKEGLL